MPGNLLASETSPYLLQHKDNPVHWRPWSAEALNEAKEANKPLLVSIGYAACHWCHVMAHESFEDEETAALINELYVPVKIDREERPDIDAWLQNAMAVTGESGGWPLNAFLTPQGEPFWAGTYFPKEDAMGRPAFKTVLRQIAQRYREKPEATQPNIEHIKQITDRAWNQDRSGKVDPILVENITIATAQRFDIFFGGMTGAPKFPSLASVALLWRAYLRTGTPQFAQIVMTSLDSMSRGGIYDHVGGGFARYAVDERWILPHFEKMLYDNAQFIEMLTLIWQTGRNPTFRNRVEGIVEWLNREMIVEDSAFAASLDADSEGEEGKYYVWTEAEIDAALIGTLIPRFKQVYGVTAEGNYNGRNVLHRYIPFTDLTEADENLFAAQLKKLHEVREKRVKPLRDDKVLADWNGMMIAALAFAGPVLGRPEWVKLAEKAFAFVCEKLGDGDKLFHTYRAGKRQHPGFADDYANMARAALRLYETTHEKRYLDRAVAWTRVLNEDFWDLGLGGYVFSPKRDEQRHVKIRSANDNVTPSANGTMLEVLVRLYYATGDKTYNETLNALINAFAGDLQNSHLQMATFLNGIEFCMNALQIVIVGPPADPRTLDLVNAVLGRSVPNKIVTVIPPDEELPELHPARGKKMENGEPTAYICRANLCSAPVTSAVNLSQALLMPAQEQGAVQAAAAPRRF
ncbi:MAG: thioredoxin domain-containing protein [Micropepsaceae bacterium]